MRVLYIDIDSLRPDHLGCYGYERNTSPNIDALAQDATRFEHVYVTDAPCLPSRTALWSGRNGYHTGLVNHGGAAAQPRIEGRMRDFRDLFGRTGWLAALRAAGMFTATVSSFGERHSAWHWYAGYNEIYNPGFGGLERADEVFPIVQDWLGRHGKDDNWFLHVNLWDPHTPYRTPASYGNPFEHDPAPSWLTDETIDRMWHGFGPRSAQEPLDWVHVPSVFPRMPEQIDSVQAAKQWIDGYDVGVRYADDYIGRIVNELSDLGVLDETVVVVSADHGENLGELNIWGDHHTADAITCHIPLIIRWPGQAGRVDSALHYHYDWAATLIELMGGAVPANWDGQSFAEAFRSGEDAGRNYLVTSQGAWSCQRGVRFDNYLLLQTLHDGYKELEPLMLFDLYADPHQQHDIAREEPEVMSGGLALLADWQQRMMLSSPSDTDPLMTVLREGGPHHTRGELARYLRRLNETGREQHAARLAALHPNEI